MTDKIDNLKSSESKDGEEGISSKIENQPVYTCISSNGHAGDQSNIDSDSKKDRDQSSVETCSNSADDKSRLSHNEHMNTNQSGEMDSPTKRFNEFTVLIGETEASMRDRLSELTLPGTSDYDDDKSKPDAMVRSETLGETTEEKENDDMEVREEGKENETVEEDKNHGHTTELEVTDTVADIAASKNTVNEVRSEEAGCTNDVTERTHVQNDLLVSNDTSARELQIDEGVSDNVYAIKESHVSETIADNKSSPDKEVELTKVQNDESLTLETSQMETVDSKTDNQSHNTSQPEVHSEVNPEDSIKANDYEKFETGTNDNTDTTSNSNELTSEIQVHNVQSVNTDGYVSPQLDGRSVVNANNTSNDEAMIDTLIHASVDGIQMLRRDEIKDIKGTSDSNANENNQNVNEQELNQATVDNLNVKTKDNDVEIVDNQGSKEGIDNSSEKNKDRNERTEASEVINDSIQTVTENDVEENFMIIDVRSLTDSNEIEDKSNEIEGNSNENNSNEAEKAVKNITRMDILETTNQDKPDENQGTDDTLADISVKDSETVKRSQSSSNSKSKRKSPNSVRRITDQMELIERVAVTNSTNTSSTFQTATSTQSISLLTGMVSTIPSATTSATEPLPVISNTFSVKDYIGPFSQIKSEPLDDGMYGMMQNNNFSQTPLASASAVTSAVTLDSRIAVIHKGQVVSQGGRPFRPGRPQGCLNQQKLVISKVPPMVCPTAVGVSPRRSAPASLTRFPLSTGITQVPQVQTVPRFKISSEKSTIVSMRNLAPKNAVPLQSGSISTVSTSDAAHYDKGKDKIKDLSLVNKHLSTINIHSVGVARITDLIARKNPIPTFKPDPIPENLKDVQDSKIYPCYECGDSFHFERSLKQHIGRCSMKIFYKCEKCVKTLNFTNKCQLLNHLRSHLNIEKTQAVPIHIKSDSIEIETYYNDIVVNKPFEWFKETNISTSASPKEVESVSAFKCVECHKVFTEEKERIQHFQGDGSQHFHCEECPLFLNSKCALQSHVKLHKLSDVRLNKLGPDNLQLLKSLSCPECGILFWKPLGSMNVSYVLNEMTLHLKNVCFHLSSLPAYRCRKCSKVFQSFEGMKNHFNTSLEHYYKCGLCPMALKSLKSLESHNNMKHKLVEDLDKTTDLNAKIIYRCHVCDTLIDDKSFLVQHIDKHLEDCKNNPLNHYHCLHCGQLFLEKNALKRHHNEKHGTVRKQFWCTFCSSDKLRAILYITHMLKTHTSTRSYLASRSVVKFCDYCGLVCVGEHMFSRHPCLGKRNAPIVIGDRAAARDRPIAAGKKETREAADEGVPFPISFGGKCVVCSEVFLSMTQRLTHLKEHRDIDLIFICKFCDMMNFSNYHELKSHEIACTAMSKMGAQKPTSGPSKNGSPQKRKLKGKAEVQKLNESEKGKSTPDKKPVSDGVQLIPKDSKKKSKGKREVVEHFICEKCNDIFTRKSKLDEHIKSEHGIHPCHLCGLMHESQSSLKKHLMVDHEGKRMLFYCGICKSRKIEKAFSVREKLIKHFKLKHRMKIIDESKIITQLPGLPESGKSSTPESHKRKLSESVSPETSVKKLKIEGEIDFKCAKCLFTCGVKSEFRQHILEHKAADSYQCLECGLCFAVLPSLKKHVFMVHKVRDFNSYMEENHIEEPTALEDKDVDIIKEPIIEVEEVMEESSEEEMSGDPLECKVCYKSFENETVLKSHIRTHGMAFIKKSRRRAKTVSPGKRSANDISYSSSQEEGKKDGLVLKIKRLKHTDANEAKEDSKHEDTAAIETGADQREEDEDTKLKEKDHGETINSPEILKTESVDKSSDKVLNESDMAMATNSEISVEIIDIRSENKLT